MTRQAALLAAVALVASWHAAQASSGKEAQCSQWKRSYETADTSECVQFVHERAECVTEKGRLRELLVRHCRDRKPVAAPQHMYNITIIIPSANRREAVLHRTLQTLWAELPACTASSSVHVAVYNVGDHRNEGFFRSNEFRNTDQHGCASFVEWFHAYEQPFPELPYIAEEGPDWEHRRDIPAAEHIDQTFDYLSILRDAFWFYPAHAYLLLEDDFEVCPGAVAEMLRVQGLLNEGEPTWGGVQFAYGGSGWLINRGFVRQLAAYLHEHAYTRPVDLLLHAYFGTMRRPVFASNATLFSHVGTVSTFPARRHEEYPSCGQVNSAMHFRNAFVPCPYQELASYLCDWPHASVLYQTHHAAAPPQPQPQQWMPPPQHPQQHPQQHQQWQQQQQHAGAGRAYGDKRPAPEGGGGEGNPYTYSPQQALHGHMQPGLQEALHFQAQQQQHQAMMHQHAMHQAAAQRQAQLHDAYWRAAAAQAM